MKRLTIEDMDRLVYLAVPDLKHDGREAVCTVARADKGCNDFVPQVRRFVLSETGKLEKDELVAERSELAKYSPDGSRLAWLCTDSGESQIWIRENGTDRQLTHLRHGVTDYSWSPDGQSLVWGAPLWPEETDAPFGEMTSEEKRVWKKKKDSEPIVVEELMYKLDEVGLFDGSFHQIGVTALDGSSVLLTKAPFEHRNPVISPDGRQVAYYACPDGSIHRLRVQIFTCPLPESITGREDSHKGSEQSDSQEGARDRYEERQVTHEEYLIESVPLMFDPADAESDRVAALMYEKTENGFVQLPYLFSLTDGKKEPLFEAACPVEEINNLVVGRNAVGREAPPCVFSEDGGTYYFTSLWMGNQHLYVYDRAKKEFTCLGTEDESIQALSAPRSGRMVYLKGTLMYPAELYWRRLAEDAGEKTDTKEAAEHALTQENAWLSEYELPRPEKLCVPTADQKGSVHGWYIKPAGLKPGEKVPAVLDVHGGPECSYSTNFWFEFQYLASRGLAVVYCDPRGSVGYGSAHQKGDCAYGTEAQEDLLGFLDAVIALGFIDETKCGVTGGSYGGYMTNRLISTTDRFAAAVTQRNLCNLATSYGTGDMGFVTGKKDFTSMLAMFKDRVNARATTLRLVDRVKTPLLILHGTQDYRCSFEQGEQLFIAMKERNPQIPVRFVAFPGENHGLTRGGRPEAQKGHLKEMADWFVRFLKEGEFAQQGPQEDRAEKAASGMVPSNGLPAAGEEEA